jgi:hypothetical protein
MAGSKKEREQVIAWLQEDLGKSSDPNVAQEFAPIIEEIVMNLNEDTRIRFADYVNLRSDPTLKPDERLALGLAGWLYGAGLAERNLSVVRSGYIARRMITESLAGRRKNDALIQSIMKLESGTPRYVTRILENMPPAVPTGAESLVTIKVPSSENPQESIEQAVPGRYLLEVPTSRELGGGMVRYMVQLPAEYNPYRKYPCILALPSEEIPFNDAMDWWTSPDRTSPEIKCYGDPCRYGYIVISPEWNEFKQPVYNYTENEHQMILRPLRDAMRRFSIDSDRVFVAGHFMGADAAWDLAMAHPDLWAGAIMIGAIAKKYIIQYWPNARYVPT